MNIDQIKNKTKEIMNAVHSRGEVNTHLDHKLERTLTSDQIKQRDALLQDKRVRLNYPLTANTYMNKSMKHLLIQMKKLSLRVNYKLDKNFDTGKILIQKKIYFKDKSNQTLKTTHDYLLAKLEDLFLKN